MDVPYSSMNNAPSTTPLVSQKIEDPNAPKRSGNSKISCLNWVFTILVWLFFILMCSTDGSAMVWLFIICYLIYIVLELLSPTFSYLRHQSGNERMYEKMGQLFSTTPTLQFVCECYHYETRPVEVTDSKGRKYTRMERVRIVTHRDDEYLPIYSSRDVSGLFLLDMAKASTRRKAFIKLHLQKEINFADAISYSDYLAAKTHFWARNRFRDIHMDFHEYREIPGMKEHNLVQISDYRPCGISPLIYFISALLTVCQFYKYYVDAQSVYQHYKIRKIVSTRYNLMEPQFAQMYASFAPALNVYDQMYNYEAKDVGYCSSEVNASIPTEEELQAAQQYNNFVPQYQVNSAGSINDLPSFGQVNYDLPPPEYAQYAGDKALSDNQLQRDN